MDRLTDQERALSGLASVVAGREEERCRVAEMLTHGIAPDTADGDAHGQRQGHAVEEAPSGNHLERAKRRESDGNRHDEAAGELEPTVPHGYEVDRCVDLGEVRDVPGDA